ncbi:MAG: acyl carrier protein [Proteobacteria bacterium]|nr:acyl carrier protein [Pseudomonadota bacterium]MBU1710654.1 acyl carrier protein [Pseudomonadota bacterium]
MISDEQVRGQIIDVLADEFELDPELLKPEATLFDDLGLDSLDAVDMIVALEKSFGMKMTNEEAMRSVRTLDDLFLTILKIRDQKASEK